MKGDRPKNASLRVKKENSLSFGTNEVRDFPGRLRE
jgi:hypothetical protein